MDMLRLNYPEPNIYSDGDEGESTEGSKLHKLDMKIYRMVADDVNPGMDAFCERLIEAGCQHDLVLSHPLLDWDPTMDTKFP